MPGVLRQRNFLLLWVSGLISMAGDWVLIAALPIYVYTLTRSTLATSLMGIAELIPFAVGSVAGVYVDRWPRKRVLVGGNCLLALALLPLLLVHSAHLVWLVYLVGFVQSLITQFSNPAENALLPTLVPEDQLVAANSMSSLNRNIARLVGPALGGLIAVWTGLTGVTLIDAVTFAIAALLVMLISAPEASNGSDVEKGESPATGMWHEWLEGLRLVRGNRTLSIMVGIFTLTALGEGVFGTMFVVWVRDVLKGSALQFGWFMSAQAIGGVLGGLAIGAVGGRIAPVRLAWIGGSLFALLDITLFSYPLAYREVWLGLVIMAVVGLPAAAGGSSMQAVLQLATPDEFRGRVFGALGTTAALAQLLGTGIAGLAGGIFGPIALLNVFQGGSYMVASLLILLMSGTLMAARARHAKYANSES